MEEEHTAPPPIFLCRILLSCREITPTIDLSGTGTEPYSGTELINSKYRVYILLYIEYPPLTTTIYGVSVAYS